MGIVIGVISGKGGVGKTTSSVNLGAALSHNFKKSVVVVDTNVSSSNLSLHVGAHFHPITLNHVLKGEANIEEAIVNHPSGMKIVPASLSVDDLFMDVTRLPEVISELKEKYDVVVLDTAPGIGSETISSLKTCDGVVIVTTPHLPSVTDALKTVRLAEKLEIPVYGVILNMYRKKAPLTVTDVEYMTNNKVIGVIPYDTNVDDSVMKKVPVVHYKAGSKTSDGFMNVAAKMIGQNYEPSKTFFEKFVNLFVEFE